MLIDTDKVSDLLKTAERLNDSLIEINEAIEALEDTSNVLQFSIFHNKFKETIPLGGLESVGQKSVDFATRPIVLACLKDLKKFIESELDKVLPITFVGGNE